MSDSTDRYYRTLAVDYAVTIRQLVPRYDEMLETITALVQLLAVQGRASGMAAPAARSASGTVSDGGVRSDCQVLDIGAGSGEVSALLLSRHADVRITALEPSAAMVEVLRARLAAWSDRVRIEATDALHFATARPFAAVVSNLVLHNLGNRDKRRVLRNITRMLAPGGAFVWGDMIVQSDARLQRGVIAERTRHARAAGCDEALIAENFRKEAEDDSPWTIHDTLVALRRAGFRDVDCAWSAGAFAIFTARRKGKRP